MIKIKRIYEPAAKSDGERILVDRLWPRGVSKDEAKVDLWLKDLGVSPGLRTWFGHDPKRWVEFSKKYEKELRTKDELIAQVRDMIRRGTVTLVIAAKDPVHNHALVLKRFLENE